MSTQANRNGTKLVKAFGLMMGALLVLAPGAAAQGALDVAGNALVEGRGQADAHAATQIVDQTLSHAEEVAYEAQGALEAKTDLDLQAHVDAPVKAEGAAGAGVGFVATVKGYMDGLVQKFKGFFTSESAKAEAEVNAQAEFATESAYETGERVIGEAEAQLENTQQVAAYAEYEARAEAEASGESAMELGYGLIGEVEGAVNETYRTASEAHAHVGVNADVSGEALTNGGFQPPSIPRPTTGGWFGLTSSLQAALTGLIQLGGFGF